MLLDRSRDANLRLGFDLRTNALLKLFKHSNKNTRNGFAKPKRSSASFSNLQLTRCASSELSFSEELFAALGSLVLRVSEVPL